jgi:hypothetical protein
VQLKRAWARIRTEAWLKSAVTRRVSVLRAETRYESAANAEVRAMQPASCLHGSQLATAATGPTVSGARRAELANRESSVLEKYVQKRALRSECADPRGDGLCIGSWWARE